MFIAIRSAQIAFLITSAIHIGFVISTFVGGIHLRDKEMSLRAVITVLFLTVLNLPVMIATLPIIRFFVDEGDPETMLLVYDMVECVRCLVMAYVMYRLGAHYASLEGKKAVEDVAQNPFPPPRE